MVALAEAKPWRPGMFHENTHWPCTDGIMPAKSGKEDREKTDMHDASSDGPAGFGMLHDSPNIPCARLPSSLPRGTKPGSATAVGLNSLLLLQTPRADSATGKTLIHLQCVTASIQARIFVRAGACQSPSGWLRNRHLHERLDQILDRPCPGSSPALG